MKYKEQAISRNVFCILYPSVPFVFNISYEIRQKKKMGPLMCNIQVNLWVFSVLISVPQVVSSLLLFLNWPCVCFCRTKAASYSQSLTYVQRWFFSNLGHRMQGATKSSGKDLAISAFGLSQGTITREYETKFKISLESVHCLQNSEVDSCFSFQLLWEPSWV